MCVGFFYESVFYFNLARLQARERERDATEGVLFLFSVPVVLSFLDLLRLFLVLGKKADGVFGFEKTMVLL
jgi:hypothetical protein